MISDYAQRVLSQSRGKHLLLDSNLLLLLLLGSFDLSLIGSFKRISDFSVEDLRALQELSRSFKLATSAHVLTEVSNLSNQLPLSKRQVVFPYIASRIPFLREDVVPALQVASNVEFSIFGLTDAVLAELRESHLLITNDWRLAAHLRGKNHPVLTLRDLRVGSQ